MSEINVVSREQRIVVDPFSSQVSVFNAGPPGLMGPQGTTGPGLQGPPGEVTTAQLNAATAGIPTLTTDMNALLAFMNNLKASFVNTQETTASGTYVDLVTVGPSVTLTTKTKALILIGISYNSSTAPSAGSVAIDVTGATTIAASDFLCITLYEPNTSWGQTYSGLILVESLNAGVNTFKLKYKSWGGTASYSGRTLCVVPLAV